MYFKTNSTTPDKTQINYIRFPEKKRKKKKTKQILKKQN